MNVVQNHTLFWEMGAFPEYATEDDAGFGWGDFDGRFDRLESVWGDGVDGGPFDDLEVA